jgi:hypothetical protein
MEKKKKEFDLWNNFKINLSKISRNLALLAFSGNAEREGTIKNFLEQGAIEIDLLFKAI